MTAARMRRKSNFNQYGSRSVRLRWRYSVDLPLPPRRSADNPAALPSRRDFSLGYDRLARAGHGKPRPVREPPRRVGALGRPAVLSSLSYTTTLRSLSALMILLFSGLSPERTMLINDGVTPFFFAHFFWLPARLTSKRSKRTTSF
jgi:hypothetical protein